MATPFPITLPAGSVLGRLALTAGDAESIPLASLSVALGRPFINSPVIARKTADQSVASSVALANDSDLTFAIAANEEWVAEFYIDAGSGLTTTGALTAITVPSGATLNAITSSTGMATSAGAARTTTSGSAMTFSQANYAQANPALIVVSVWVLNGGTAGAVTLQWAQQTSSGTALTFRKGSFMRATRIA